MRRFFRSSISRAAPRFRARSKRREKLRRHLPAAQSGDARQRAFRKRPRRSGGCTSPVPAVFVNIPFSQTCRTASRFRARSKRRREKLRRHLPAARSGDARQRAFRKRPRRGGGCASPVPAVFVNIPFSQPLPRRVPLPRPVKAPPRKAAQASDGCSKRRCASASLSSKSRAGRPYMIARSGNALRNALFGAAALPGYAAFPQGAVNAKRRTHDTFALQPVKESTMRPLMR